MDSPLRDPAEGAWEDGAPLKSTWSKVPSRWTLEGVLSQLLLVLL